jgi:hypothetical protein
MHSAVSILEKGWHIVEKTTNIVIHDNFTKPISKTLAPVNSPYRVTSITRLSLLSTYTISTGNWNKLPIDVSSASE